MRVSATTVSDSIIQQLQTLTNQQTKLQTQVGTGLRLNQPSDDPAAMGRVLNMNAQLSAVTQYGTNASTALAVSQATFSSLQQIKSISDRATQIGTLGNGAQSPSALTAYGSEVDQLLEQTVQLANSQWNNNYLFAGTAVDSPPYTVTRDTAGKITGVAFNGNTAQASVPLSSTSSITPGADATTTQGVTDFLNHLVALRDGLNANDTAAITTTQTGLVATEDVFVSSIAEQGAVQTRINVNQAQQQALVQNLTQDVSNETSTDMTTATVQLSQAQTSYQAALQSAASIMQMSLLNYLQ